MKTRTITKSRVYDIIFDTVKWIFMVIFVLVTLYPIINTVAVSFNEGMDSLRGGITFLPRKVTLENYRILLTSKAMGTAAVNTVARTVIATVLHLATTALLAYVLSRKDFVFKKSLSLLYVMTMYLNAGMIPGFLLIQKLNLLNTFMVYIIPGMVSAFNMIVIRTFMNEIPESLGESAEIDGAGHMRIFVQIILPLCKPVLATVALFIAVGQWNSWFDTMLYNGFNSSLTTLQYELMKLLSSVSTQGATAEAMKNASNLVTPTSVRAAATVFTALPIVCLYPFLQRYFVTGLTIGGVKE